MNKINLNLYRSNIYNKVGLKEAPHYGEDGVIEKIFEVIEKKKSPFIVEFGETRSLGTTTRAFRIRYKSKSLYFTGKIGLFSKILNVIDIVLLIIKKRSINYVKFFFNLPKQIFCTELNIIEIFKKNSVPKEFDILTIDIDSNDYYIARKILNQGYRPSLLILEYNPNIPIHKSLAIKNVINFPNKKIYGASFLAINNLANLNNYHLVHISGFCNLFYIRKEFIDFFEPPNINDEFTGTREKVLKYIEKYCMRDFIPSWLNSNELTEDDFIFFEKI